MSILSAKTIGTLAVAFTVAMTGNAFAQSEGSHHQGEGPGGFNKMSKEERTAVKYGACARLSGALGLHDGLSLMLKGSKVFSGYNAVHLGTNLKKACNISDTDWNAIPSQDAIEPAQIDALAGEACNNLMSLSHSDPGFYHLFHGTFALGKSLQYACAGGAEPKTPTPK